VDSSLRHRGGSLAVFAVCNYWLYPLANHSFFIGLRCLYDVTNQDAFRAETADSTQTVDNLFFSNNANAGSSVEWSGILVQGGATGSVTRSTFESNQAIQVSAIW
jgi:hypothetical protein